MRVKQWFQRNGDRTDLSEIAPPPFVRVSSSAYRQRARECRDVAANARDIAARDYWRAAEASWLALARHTERELAEVAVEKLKGRLPKRK
jgi:hypothetical protein